MSPVDPQNAALTSVGAEVQSPDLPIHERVAQAKRLFDRTLQRWACDVLRFQQRRPDPFVWPETSGIELDSVDAL